MKATSERDIISTFNQFLARMTNNSTLCLHQSHIKQGQSLQYEISIDKNTSHFFGSCSWLGSKIGVSLISPNGKIITESSAGTKWFVGDKYISVKVTNPVPGKWKANLTGLEIPSGGEPFTFEVNADAPLMVDLIDNEIAPGRYEFAIKEIESSERLSDFVASVHAITPKNDTLNLSNQLNNRSFNFIANAGPGSYRFQVNLMGKDSRSNPVQRFIQKTVLVGDFVPVHIAPVKYIIGNFLKADLGKQIGNRSGVKCVIFSKGGTSGDKLAVGYVTHLSDRECTIELQQFLSPKKIVVGDMIELDLVQWSKDFK
ncbi:hypothetical protein BVY01_02485 [bacterium I07]|nr:hypothetical protein BVY01_02485 [bacterium I07]